MTVAVLLVSRQQGGNNIFQSYYYDYEQVSSPIFIFAHGIKKYYYSLSMTSLLTVGDP